MISRWFFCSLMVSFFVFDVARKAFERLPAKFKPTSLRRSNCDVACSVVVFFLRFFITNGSFCCSLIWRHLIWRHFELTSDCILHLTKIRSDVKKNGWCEGRKRKQTFATVLIPRKLVWRVVGRVESGSVPSWRCVKLTASLPIHRSGQRSALGAARSEEKYIWCTREDTRVLLKRDIYFP